MALVNCPECGREKVSDSAPTCPECGFAIREHFEKIEQERVAKEQSIQRQKQAEEKRKRDAENKRVEEQRRLENIKMPEKPRLATGKFFGVIGLWILIILLSVSI